MMSKVMSPYYVQSDFTSWCHQIGGNIRNGKHHRKFWQPLSLAFKDAPIFALSLSCLWRVRSCFGSHAAPRKNNLSTPAAHTTKSNKVLPVSIFVVHALGARPAYFFLCGRHRIICSNMFKLNRGAGRETGARSFLPESSLHLR